MTDSLINGMPAYEGPLSKSQRLTQCSSCGGFCKKSGCERENVKPKEWQGLTENEIKHLWYEACQTNLELTSQLIVHLARNIEAKLKEKNT